MSIQNLSGQTLGQYELRDLLGAGGMGAVYRGYQSNLKRYVAVKVLASNLAEQPGALERFNREAQTSAALEHAHIIRIYDYGTQRGISYLVMQLLTGGSLQERIAQRVGTDRPLPSPGEVSTLLRQVASALDYAHSQGVIHRDIKPSNVMFDNHGNAFLVDFGIAKLTQATSGLTASGLVIGTWGYMAPEQWKNETLTPATDQYALAVMTYALITGQMPFDAPTPAGVMHRHLNEMPTPLHSRRPDVSEAVTAVIERALAKNPAERFPSVTALAQAFDRSIRGQTGEMTGFFTAPVGRKTLQTLVQPLKPTAAARRPSRAHLLAGGVGALILALAAAVVFLLLTRDQPDSKSSDPAARPSVAAVVQPTDRPRIEIVATDTPDVLAAAVTLTETATSTLTPTATPSATPSATPTATATLAPTHTLTGTPTATLTATLTPIPSETPNLQATVDAILVQRLTETATHWTATPTPNIEASVVAAMTGTAERWTATPTFTPPPTATFTPLPTATHPPLPTATNPPPPTPIPTATPVRVALRVIRPASNDEARLYPSIWDGLNFINLEGPGVQSYPQTIDATPRRWAFSWCGSSEQHFQSILGPFTITFEIDGAPVDSSALLQFDSRGVCRNWVTVLDGWRSGSQVTLDIHYHLSQPVQGGTGIRDAGDYYQRIVVTVR